MIRLTRTQVQPIGLDLGLDSIKMLQLEVVADKTLSVLAAAKQSLTAEVREQPELQIAASMDVVRQMLRNNNFTGRRVVAALPRYMIHTKNIRLPMMPPAELASAVEFESRNIFSFDMDRTVVRYLPTGEVRHGADSRLEVIVVAVKQKDIDGFVEQLHGTGCILESLDFEPSAIYRGVERFIRRREDENEVHVIAEIGARRTQVIIGKGRDISFFKPIEIGSRHFHEAVATKLQISNEEARSLRRRLTDAVESAPLQNDSVRQAVHDATRSTIEELAREISLCLRYYSVTFRGQRPTKVRLLGGESADPQLLAALGSVLPVPVEAGRPLASVDTSRMKQSDRRGYMGEWAVAFGLALKSTTGYFGARDGKKRGISTNVEVVDLTNNPEAAAEPPVQEAANA
jgi:type IV pilus assembly protein PilM